MRERRRVGLVGALIALALILGVRPLDAQGVSAEAGQQFVGKWTLTMEPFQGGFGGGGGGGGGAAPQPMVLDIITDAGNLKATLTGGGGPMAAEPREMTSITLDGQTLVLGYSLSFGGNSIPATIRLTPDASSMQVETVFNDEFRRSGTATKE